MDSLLKDIRYGLRSLMKRPAFTVVAVITLGLGIGVNTAIFSVINAVLLRPLPYANPERLITFHVNQSAPDLADIEAQSKTVSRFGGMGIQRFAYTGGSEPVEFAVGLVTGGLFETLGVQPQIGRYITTDDDKNGAPFVVVLGHDLWIKQFNGDPQIVGKTIPLGGNVYTIIGVMSASFIAPRENTQAWSPAHVSDPGGADDRGVHIFRTYGRLADGVSLDQARAEMAVIDKNLAAQYPADNKNRRSVLLALHERIVGDSRQSLLILFASVSLVLLIACANFANLLLARAAEREREFVIRGALGAGRWRLIRQLLTESVLVSLAGGALAVVLAIWMTNLLVAFKPENLPRLQEIGIDGRVLVFTLGVSLLTGLVFGLLPAWSASRSGVAEALKEGGRSTTAGGARQRLRNTFVVVELAVALVLLVGAGLLIKTFWKLRSVEAGFNPDHLITMRVQLPETRYEEVATQTRFRNQILAGINTLPGTHAAMISELPLSGDSLDHEFVIENRPPVAPGDEPSLEARSVLGDYFKVMQIPLRAGRDFGPQDLTENAPTVGIANEEMVRQHFHNEDPIGKRIRWASDSPIRWITIVGVVGDVKHFGLDLPELPALYSPYTQINRWKRWMSIAARTDSTPSAMAQLIKQEIWKVDPQLPVTRVETMDEMAAESFAARSFNMTLLTVFAGLALVLAAIGIYGVMSYAVTQRTQEIGIRMALGARTSDVLRIVLRNGMTLVVIGIALGLLGAFALTRLMVTLLFGVTPTDTSTIGLVSVVLIVVAFIACFIPARRATKVDPLVALRYE